MDQLIESAPSNQTELDIFKNDWFYDIPVPNTVTGPTAVDPISVRLAKEHFGPLDDFRVLELGPHECEITIFLSKEKVKKIISIECRSRLFLKCLVIKNILKMDNVRFLLGNFNEYLNSQNEKFDLCLACGVLYHMTDPVELIERICSKCDRVIVISHYVNDHLINWPKDGLVHWNIIDEAECEYKGLKVKYFKNDYGSPPENVFTHISAGQKTYSNMMERDDIVRAFEHFGFEIVGEPIDVPDGGRGPYVIFAAKRKGEPLSLTRSKILKSWRDMKRQLKKRVSVRPAMN